jgi:hypothetical protein
MKGNCDEQDCMGRGSVEDGAILYCDASESDPLHNRSDYPREGPGWKRLLVAGISPPLNTVLP